MNDSCRILLKFSTCYGLCHTKSQHNSSQIKRQRLDPIHSYI